MRVTEKEITQIRLFISDKDITDIEMNTQLLKVGEIKKIISSPLSGLECETLKAVNVNIFITARYYGKYPFILLRKIEYISKNLVHL